MSEHFIGINDKISHEVAHKIANILHDRGKNEITNIVLNSPGGAISAAFKIIKLLWQYTTKEVNIYIVDRAKSAATFLCLGGTQLYMSDVAELGPIDPQIIQEEKGAYEQYSVISHRSAIDTCADIACAFLDKTVNLLIERTGNLTINNILTHAINYSAQLTKPVFEKLEPHKLAEYSNLLTEALKYVGLIQSRYHPDRNLKKVAHSLMFNYPSHSFVIDNEQLKKLGFIVNPIDKHTHENIINNKKGGVFTFKVENKKNEPKTGRPKPE